MSALLIYLSIAITEIMIGNTDQFIAPDWEYRPWVEVVDDEGAYSVRWLEWDDIDTDGATVLLRDDEGSIIASAYYPAAIARCSWAKRDDGTWSYTSTPTPGAPNSGGWASVRLDAPEPSGGQRFFADSTTVSVTIPEGLTLRYTTDGSAPTLANGNTSPDGRFTLRQTTALRLCFVADGYLPSAVVSQTYVRQDFAHPLPIVSVMSDSLNLWGDTLGIFVEGTNGTTLVLANGTVTANWNADWERPANVELFGADGDEVWNLEAGIKRFGYTSRRYQPCGFKITAKKRYEGLNYLPAQVFSTRPYRRHRSLAMRCGSDYVCRIKDPLIGEILRRSSLNIDVQAYQPVMHYINGHYAGTINLRETSNRHFVFTNYGLDDDEIDFFQMDPYSGYAQSYGTRDAFERWYALAAECGTSDEAYDELCQLVDIDELCNYLATQFYICNNDWPPNNLKAFRPTEDGGRFRFILFDLDAAWNTQYPIGSFLNRRTFTFNDGVRREVEFVSIVVSMLSNATFRKHLVDAMSLVAGSVFEPERCREIITELCEAVEEAQALPSEVYGEGSSPWASAQEAIDNISADHRDMIYSRFMSYGLTRPATLQPVSLDLTASVASARLLLNGQPIPTGELHGRVFAPAVLRAEAPAGYAFTGWRQALGTAKSIDLIAQGQWTAATTDSLASIETEATVTLEAEPSEGDEMLFTWQADDGFVLSVNGTEALRYHMPEGTITSSTQATTTCYYNPDRGIASLPIGLFRKGENTLTASVHDHYDGINAQDITWSAALTWHRNEANESIVSTSAEYALPEQGTYVLEACFEALDEANTPPVVVNEVSAGNTVSVNEYFKRDDWVELYNTTADTLDLAGLLLNDWPIEGPSTLIAPHGYKIIWCSKREAVSELHAPFKLTNADGQCIRLASPDGEWADSLVYCEHGGRQSVGRYPDATSNVYLMERTTIGASNALTTADAVVTLSGTNGVEAPKEQATPALPSRSYDLSGRPYSGRGLRIEKGRKVVR